MLQPLPLLFHRLALVLLLIMMVSIALGDSRQIPGVPTHSRSMQIVASVNAHELLTRRSTRPARLSKQPADQLFENSDGSSAARRDIRVVGKHCHSIAPSK